MIVQFTDRVAGTSVYINPEYGVSLRPDPADPDAATVVKVSDGETQVSREKRGGPPAPATRMRKNDQRAGAGLGCGIAYSHLAPRCVVWRNGEDVLGSLRNILARILCSRGIPNLTREQAVPCRIEGLDRPHTNRKSTAKERIVLVRPGCRPVHC